MVSKFTLISNFLLASVALAIPSRLEARLASRRENRQSRPVDRVEAPPDSVSNVVYSSNWAGAIWDRDGGTFNSVTGTFTVPTPSGGDGAASAWVGIDGKACSGSILQTGVDFMIYNGQVSYHAWSEWYPDNAYGFSDISINAGDVIRTTVTTDSTTSGTAIVENLTNGQTASKQLSSSSALCEQNAEWIVEDFRDGSNLVPFVNFGTVTFSSASASGPGNSYSPSGATIIEIQQNGQTLTSVSTSDSSVTVQYV